MMAAEGFSGRQRLQITLISWIGWMLVWLIGSTLRFRTQDWERLEKLKEGGRPLILSFWHNQIFVGTFFFRFRNIVVITSRNFDGEYIARIIERFGYGAARGSSSRGAVSALIQLRKHLEDKRDVAFSIDGPRGPRYQVKPGPLWLAQKTGVPILPFHFEPKSYWSLNSWDKFRIPKPFSPVLLKIGNPLCVPASAETSEWTRQYQEEMDRLRHFCAAYWQTDELNAES